MKKLWICTMAVFLMFVAASGAFAQYGNPCEEDIAKFCSNVKAGKGAIAECLSRNEGQLADRCKVLHLGELSTVLRQTNDACAADSAQFCGAQQQEGGIALLTCLRTQATLSPGCRAKLQEALELMRY